MTFVSQLNLSSVPTPRPYTVFMCCYKPFLCNSSHRILVGSPCVYYDATYLYIRSLFKVFHFPFYYVLCFLASVQNYLTEKPNKQSKLSILMKGILIG